MELSIDEFDDVWTSDDYNLGSARCWHARPEEEVRPGEQLYAFYLEVENFRLGESFFVPSDYLVGYDEAGERVLLDASLKTVMGRTWTRLPDFVAKKQGRVLPLQPRSEEVASE